MLILARRPGQRIELQMPEGVPICELVVLEMDEDHQAVKIGFNAPQEVKILRSEIINKQQRNG